MDEKILPDGWKTEPFEQAVEIWDTLRKPINNTERQNRIQSKNTDELYPYYGATGLVGYIDGFLTDGEYVLLGEDGAPFLDPLSTKAYIINGKAWVNNHAHVLKSKYNNKFLCHYLNYFRYEGYVTGTTRLKLTQGSMKTIPIVIPSLQEQERIVAKIEELFSELDKGVSELQKVKAQLKVYRQAVLKEAFGEIKSFTTMDTLAEMIDPHPSHRTPPVVADGVPYIGIGDIDYVSMKILFSTARKVAPTLLCEHKERYILKAGDFIMGKIGTIGKPYRVELPQNYTLSANVILIQPNSERIHPSFLFWQFASPIVTQQLSLGATATSQPAFGIKKARLLKIRICDMETQNEIVDEISKIMSVCEKIEQIVDESLKKAERLRQSILKQAFEGKLV